MIPLRLKLLSTYLQTTYITLKNTPASFFPPTRAVTGWGKQHLALLEFRVPLMNGVADTSIFGRQHQDSTASVSRSARTLIKRPLPTSFPRSSIF